jgi:hypothetical protein
MVTPAQLIDTPNVNNYPCNQLQSNPLKRDDNDYSNEMKADNNMQSAIISANSILHQRSPASKRYLENPMTPNYQK